MIFAIKMCEANESVGRHLNCSRSPSPIIYSSGSNKVFNGLSHLPGFNINKNILRRLTWYNF